MSNTADVTGGKPIAVYSQSISGLNAINPLVAFYDIYGRKREALFFYFVPDTRRSLWNDYIYEQFTLILFFFLLVNLYLKTKLTLHYFNPFRLWYK
jgi:hypothetical protein